MTDSGKSRFFATAHVHSFSKFAIVGATGVVVNEGLLIAFQSMGVYLLYASAAAIEVSILSNFALNDLWTFRDRRSGHFAIRLVKFNVLMLAGLVVNLVVLDVGTAYFGIAAAIANLVGIGAAFILRYALSVKYAWMRVESVEVGQAAPISGPLASPETAEA
jgi:dolichol-phosphate mannosyltransferase